MIKSKRMRWAGCVTLMVKGIYACRVLVGKPEERRPPGRRRIRWVNNIKIDRREVVCEGVAWICLV